MTSPAARSSRSAMLLLCSGASTSTSWMPLADACVNTGPRLLTVKGSSPENSGYRLGTTRTCHEPLGPYVSSAGGVDSSLPGQNGHGRPGSASTGKRRGAQSPGRPERSSAIVTHRPVSGLSRSWLKGDGLRVITESHPVNLILAASVHRHMGRIALGERSRAPVPPALDQLQPRARRERVQLAERQAADHE